jgi:hypothetical protein
MTLSPIFVRRIEKDLSVQIRKTDYDTVRRGMKTGQDVIQSRLYASECCGVEELLEKDASFPRCEKCKGLSTWEVVDLPQQNAA